ncbi:SpoVT / AbrB-like protein [Mycobacteroides abscessus subsp. abscessus]|nr:SpoVT / AbrB-like protein [Mycobacteroides abscessus subsp. abscessus]
MRVPDEESSSQGDDGETALWQSIPRSPESLLDAEAEDAAARTFGEEVRARFGLPAREAEVDEHIAAGDITMHEDSDALVAHLDRLDTEANDTGS